jgi:1-acyl-sn-glycerol-3-phosphate acyltransferase
MKKMVSHFYFLFCKFFFKYYCPIKVDGRENLSQSPFILCSNHTSHMDTPVLMLATGIPFKQFGMVAAKDYFFDNPWRNRIINLLMNLIPIDRNASRESLKKDISSCKHFVETKGHHLIIYPEGTRSITGEIQPFKRGPALIAHKLSMPIIPIYIDGTFQAMGKGRIFPRWGTIHVKIGKSILTNQDTKKITEQLENSVKNLKECAS